MKKQFLVIVMLIITAPIQAFRMTNSGTMDFGNSHIEFPELENTGSIISTGKGVINCKKLTGNGLIHVKSGKLTITALAFLFTGTIECDSECEIYTETDPSLIKITQKGSGKVNFKEMAQLEGNQK